MDLRDQVLSDASDEDFENLDSSSESSIESEDDITDSDSDQSDDRYARNKKNKKKPVKKVKKAPPVRIIFNVSDTQYDVVKYVGKKIFKWKLSYNAEATNWDIFWTDNAVQPETLAKMQTYQKINHFPGMYSLARKNHLGRNLMRMKKAFPDNYKFFPQTFLLPSEYNDFRMQFDGKKKKTFIAKPEWSSQGRGIFLTRTWESIQPGEHYVVQRYLQKPYLIEGLKFDMRIYVLLAGCDPLKIFLFNDGLGRFCTEEYKEPTGDNLEDMCMHLTNYAINKDSENFVFNESSTAGDVGHKRSLKAVFRTLEEKGHDVKTLWKEIKQIIIKTFCSVQPILAHNYRSCHPDEPYNNMCFELLGFDIILDHKLKPYLLEVNHTPSFATDTPLDKTIKKNAIKDALRIMNISVENKIQLKNKKKQELQQRVLTGKKVKLSPEEKQIAFENAQKQRDAWEAENCGGYTKIFPPNDPSEYGEDYEEFMKVAKNWWEEWTGLSVKRNTKKTVDPNKPPPMVFGQGTSVSAHRIKELQTSFLQKVKQNINVNTVNPSVIPKPGSSQNFRANRISFPSTSNLTPQHRKSNIEVSNYSKKFNDETQGNSSDFGFERKDTEPDRKITEIISESFNEIPEKVEKLMEKRSLPLLKPLSETMKVDLRQIEEKLEDHEMESERDQRDEFNFDLPEFRKSDFTYKVESKNLSQSANFSRNISLKTKTTSDFKVFQQRSQYKSPPPQYSEEYRSQISKQLGQSMALEKVKENPLDLTKIKSMRNPGEKIIEVKEINGKKVPLKLSTPIVGGFNKPKEEILPQTIGSVGTMALVLKNFEAERTNKSLTNLSKRTNGSNELKGISFSKKPSPSFIFQPEKPPGNFVSPKLFEIDVGVNERIIKPKMPIDSGNSPPGIMLNQTASIKTKTYQKVIGPNINHYLDSNMGLQKLLYFLTNPNLKK